MVSNCNKFVKVNQGDTCDSISFWNGVAGGQWVKQWNNLGEDCVGLQVGAYVCIGVIPDAPQPTATTGPNGISTPLPTQPHMVSNCDKFVLVKTGDTCDGIAFWNGVAGSQWVKLWNGLADDCRDIWANAYACIGVLG
jgi:purine nucleoside permease